MTIAYVTLGCKLNYAETATYERAFTAAGFQTVPWSRGADVFLVNTCSVTATSDSKSRSVIRKLHRINPVSPIVVTGCYAQLRREEVAALEGVALVFGATEKARLVPDTLEYLAALGEAVDGKAPERKAEVFPAFNTGGRTRSFLKVQDGCNNFCAYCTVPYARGRSRNIPVADAVAQAREIAATGSKEIVLTGVNTGDFGRTTGESFLELLKRLEDVEGIERYRISSIEPNLITEEIVDWIASGTKFQPHFHIPLQSGSDTILRRVGRRYDTALFASRIEYIRSRMDPGEDDPLKPYVFFGIDVIAGLPGETDELFDETYSFLRDRIRPAFIHIFPYSRRPGTPAAAWKDQVRDSVKTERVAVLEGLCAGLNAGFIEKNRGRRSSVLWESDVKDGLMGGYSGNYIRVERPYDPARVNTIEEIVI